MKQYKIGMYGGKFLPFHKGHKYCVDIAAQECERVYVILFWGGADEERILKDHSEECLSVEERLRQLDKICREAAQYADVQTHRLQKWLAWSPSTFLTRGISASQSSEPSGSYLQKAIK